MEKIKRDQQKMEQMRMDFEEGKRKMEIYERAQTAWVKLNVGGTCFETSVSTLSKCNYFEAMFSGRYQVKKNNEGDIMVRIDRDGTNFGHILNYLRNGKLEKPPPAVASALIMEADFYGLNELVEMLK